MCKVSVVIPIYKVEKYIEECLVSVLNQTLKEIEVICVNDATPDNSMDIVEHYAKTDNRIIIINKESGGVSAARNAGLNIAAGEYVYFMDSDDYIIEDTLESLYKEAKEHDLDTIYFDADSFFENDELEEKHKSYKEYYHRTADYSEVVSGQQILANMVVYNEFRPSPCLQMNRRSMLAENEINFYPGIIHEDNLFSLSVTLYSKRAKHIAKSFYKRRVRGDSIMTGINLVNSCEGYFVCIKQILPLIIKEVTEPEIMNAYMQRLRTMRNNAVKSSKQFTIEDKANIFSRIENDSVLFNMLIMDYSDMSLSKENNIKKLKEENKKIRESNSYKIGRIITYLPRAILRRLK